MDAVLARVPEFGGEVLPETNIGFGAFVRDPDGQLLELLPMSYRDSVGERPSRVSDCRRTGTPGRAAGSGPATGARGPAS